MMDSSVFEYYVEGKVKNSNYLFCQSIFEKSGKIKEKIWKYIYIA